MIDLSGKRHTAQLIKDEIISCLREYDIDLVQIYSITTDNGANVIKCSRLLQEMQEQEILGNSSSQNIEQEDKKEDWIQNEIESVLSVVRCAAHTLQLAAYDIIKTIQCDVNKCRQVVKDLRTAFRSGSYLTLPVLDNTTRWNSTFDMLESLFSLREDLENKSIISDIDWTFIETFLTAYKPVAKCSKQLQNEQYVIGDFFRDWLNCELELEELSCINKYASDLHDAMVNRKSKLFDNHAFIAALYFDPRFNFEGSTILSETQKLNALVSAFY